MADIPEADAAQPSSTEGERSAPHAVPSTNQIRALRKKMGAVLETWVRVSEADHAATLAVAAVSEASNGLSGIAGGTTVAQAEDALVRATRFARAGREADGNKLAADAQLLKAMLLFAQAKDALSQQLAQFDEETLEGVGENDMSVIEAAQHLLSQAPDYTVSVQQVEALEAAVLKLESAKDAEIEESDRQLLEQLHNSLCETAAACGRANKLSRQLAASKARVSEHGRAPSVEEPVRPTIEEVQRYLGQLEDYMVKRQESHREAAELNERARSLCQRLEALRGELEERLRLVGERFAEGAESDAEHPVPAPEVSALTVCAEAQLSTAAQAKADLVNSCFTGGYPDTSVLPAVSSRENRQITELRQAMEKTAFAIGRLNEAKQALSATPASPGTAMPELWQQPIGGVTWQDCLDWYQSWQDKKAETEREHLGHKAKIDLLQESVDSAAKETGRYKQGLRRLVVATKPDAKDGKEPCDELRRVLNMAACVYPKGERGDFPIY